MQYVIDRRSAIKTLGLGVGAVCLAAPLAQAGGITLVVEPLNRQECNVINSVAEAMEYVTAADHPQVRCLDRKTLPLDRADDQDLRDFRKPDRRRPDPGG